MPVLIGIVSLLNVNRYLTIKKTADETDSYFTGGRQRR